MHAPGSPLIERPILVTLALIALALAAQFGLDDRVARATYDVATHTFLAARWPSLEMVGHRVAKSAVWLVWLVLLAGAAASHSVEALAPYRRVLWASTAALALGPLVVTLLKSVTGPRCPWDLIEYGGRGLHAEALFVAPSEAGRCFPSGHASGGYALITLHFAGAALGIARLRYAGLWIGLIAGTAFGAVRVVQGAHFVSHNIWSATIAWSAAAAVFALAVPAAPASGAARQPSRADVGLAGVDRT